MIITNKNNLPSAFVNLSEDTREPVDKHYSTTTIIKPTRMILLERRHFNEIVDDVANRVWLVFGTAVHKILEEHDKTGYAEISLEEVITSDYILTGKCDLYNEENMSVEDYKTASVYKIMSQDFSDWKKQGLIYAWLLIKKGKLVNKIRFHALLKDWTARDKRLKGSSYPSHSIWTWEYDIKTQDLTDIETYIRDRFDELIECEKLNDNDLPICSDSDRWYTSDKWAVRKKNAARALKVHSTEESALEHLETLGKDYEIEYRPGENKRCMDYCDCKDYCNFIKGEK